MMGKGKGKGKAKTVKPKRSERLYALHLITPGPNGPVDHGFDDEAALAETLRTYLNAAGLAAKYLVTDMDANPIDFEPFRVDYLTEEEVRTQLSQTSHQLRDAYEQIDGFRNLDAQRKRVAIAAGLIPVEVLKGHVSDMAYEQDGGAQVWTLKIRSYGPAVTDAAPLTLALHALTDHLTPPPEDATPPGDPDDASQVVTTLPLPGGLNG